MPPAVEPGHCPALLNGTSIHGCLVRSQRRLQCSPQAARQCMPKEVSRIVCPFVDGAPSLFDAAREEEGLHAPVQGLKGGAVWLRYRLKNPGCWPRHWRQRSRKERRA